MLTRRQMFLTVLGLAGAAATPPVNPGRTAFLRLESLHRLNFIDLLCLHTHLQMKDIECEWKARRHDRIRKDYLRQVDEILKRRLNSPPGTDWWSGTETS